MSPQVKAALIIAGAIIITMALWIYFSPFQSCVRSYQGGGSSEVGCTLLLGGGG
jgi:hypothetical protein